MQIFLTIVTGFATFALGQIVVKLVIDPVQEFKRVVAEIAHALVEYANVFGNPGTFDKETEAKVANELRKLSSKLYAQMYLVPVFTLLARCFGLPSREQITKAGEHLIGLSNGFNSNNPNKGILNTYRSQHIRDALGIFVSERERLDPEHEKDFLNG